MSVKNEGDEEFDLTFCFHTYFTTSDLPSVGVTDLTGMQKFILKVSKFQNEFMKSSFLPKYEPNIVRISALLCGMLQCTTDTFVPAHKCNSKKLKVDKNKTTVRAPS